MSIGDRDDSSALAATLDTGVLDILLEQIPGAGVCTLDTQGGIEYWHSSAQMLLGHLPEQARGRRLESLLPEERRAEAVLSRSLFEASARGRCHLDAALMSRSGERRVCVLDIHPRLDAHGDVVGFLVLMRAAGPAPRDAGVRADADLLAAAHRSNLARADAEPAWIGIDLTARVTRLSEAAAAKLGRETVQMIGQPLAACLLPLDVAGWPVVMHRAVRADKPPVIQVVTPGVESVGFSARMVALRSTGAGVDGFTLVIAPAARAGDAAALAVGGADQRYLLAAARDLREPLRRVQRYVLQLQAAEAPRLSEDGRRQLESVQAAAGRMQAMAGGMLRLARLDTGPESHSEIDLRALVEGVREDLILLAEEYGARFEIGELGRLVGDAGQLRALFHNLIDNSIRYRREGVAPQIEIAAACETNDAGARVVIDYHDNARGMASPEAVFSPFRRRDQGRDQGDHGSGMGLPLCQRICRRHNGSIRVQHTGATGTCFRIVLDGLDSADEASA